MTGDDPYLIWKSEFKKTTERAHYTIESLKAQIDALKIIVSDLSSGKKNI